MNIGQILAMLEQSGQLPSTSQPTAQTPYQRPTINWSDVAAQQTAPEEILPTYALPAVTVSAPRYEEPVAPIYGGVAPETQDAMFAELYGAPPAGYEPMAGATPSGAFMQGAPGPEAFIAPAPRIPLPLPGVMAQAEPKKSRKGEAAAVIPYEPVAQDVPTGAQRPLAFAPGQDIAMLEPQAEPVQPEEPVWRPGKPWETQFKDKRITILGSGPRGTESGVVEEGQPIRAMDENGMVITFRKDMNPEVYSQIAKEYANKIKLATPAGASQGFTSQLRIGKETYPAKIETVDGQPRLFYMNPAFGGATEYENIGSLTMDEGEDVQYIPPISATGEDTAQDFRAMKQARLPLTKFVGRMTQAAKPFTPTPTSEEIASNITGTIEYDPQTGSPNISWRYNIPGGQISVEEAEKRKLIPKDTNTALENAEIEELKGIDALSLRAQEFQAGAAPSMYETLRKRYEENKATINAEIQKLTNPTEEQIAEMQGTGQAISPTDAAKRVKDLQKKLRVVQGQIDGLLTTGASLNIGAGKVYVEGAAAKPIFGVNPAARWEDRLALATSFSPSGEGVGVIPTPENYISKVIQTAQSKFGRQIPRISSPGYQGAMGKMGVVLNKIQDDVVSMDPNNADVILTQPALLTWDDGNGNMRQEKISLTDALNQWSDAETNYRENGATDPNALERFVEQTRKLAGSVTLFEPNRYQDGKEKPLYTWDTPNELGRIRNTLTPVQQPSMALTGQWVQRGAVREAKPGGDLVTGPTDRGRDKDEGPRVPVYPYFFTANPQKPYERYDGGFSIYEKLSSDPITFEKQLGLRDPGKASATALNDMARAAVKDRGEPGTEDVKDIKQSIRNANEIFAGDTPQSTAARSNMAKIIYRTWRALAGNGAFRYDEESFAKDMEDFRNSGGSDAVKNSLYGKYFNNDARGEYGKSNIAVEIESKRNAFPTLSAKDDPHKLWDQMKVQFDNALKLWRASSNNQSSIRNKDGKGTLITWIADPTESSQQSVISAPMANANPNVAMRYQADKNKATAIGQMIPTGDVEPAAAYLWTKLTDVLAAQSNDAYNQIQTALDPISSNAQKRAASFGWDLYTKNSDVRPKSDFRTQWNTTSDESAKKLFWQSAILYSFMPDKRYRDY